MTRAEVYSVISKCFASIEPRFWEELTSSDNWTTFLEYCRVVLSEKNADCGQSSRDDRFEVCPLRDFLSTGEVDALNRPPSFEEKQTFAIRYFDRKAAGSAPPIESHYEPPGRKALPEMLFEGRAGSPDDEAAIYMQTAIACLGMGIPEQYQDCPDHLSLELDFLAVLERLGKRSEAELFITERFQWLASYRSRLLSVAGDAYFYVGLIDVLIGLCSDQVSLDEEIAE